ncbi:MAG: type II toxin-antitoxin system RelE/ParE family toxin [Cytophagales bacterium]
MAKADNPSQQRPIIWLGDTRKTLLAFPEEVRQKIGYKLHLMQSGVIPTDTKPFKGVGSGVFEIALKHDKEAYRCVQALQLGGRIYILHVFHKKSKSGIATPTKDVDVIIKRYKDAQELEKHGTV